MRQSQLFTKTLKEAPKDEISINAQLLIRAGFIYKEMAGVYALLPLGLRVVEKIKQIVREEMNAIGGQELIMTALQSKVLWEKTGRWDDKVVDVWFKSQLKSGGEVGLGWSHEEPIGQMMKSYVASYKDLPQYVYQFQTKLRNELRAKSGIMRGREFLMKDAYSFTVDEKQHEGIYEASKVAYMKVFDRLGIGDDTYITFAAGGAFTQFSHEFQTVCDAGEDVIYINKEKNIAINKEILSDEILKDFDITKDDLTETKTAEVGNIFNFGRAKAEDLELKFADETGKQIPVWMGSYGIGITRLMGVLVEKFHDDKGIIWPSRDVAPFDLHLVSLLKSETENPSDELYENLQSMGYEVLYDDRVDARAGQKFADSDLIGIPYRIIISDKTLAQNSVEIVDRRTKESKLVEIKDLSDYLKQNV
ncbi:TPA: prolyl-tRNA synthetase [Candidatus Falkowbacteria bacterium]|nr:prolyl-tRNA synthetase [Candidatus Falkowbacteria bacterium]